MIPLQIDPYLYTAKFPERCRIDLCRSRCCRFGVWVDRKEKDRILENRHLFEHLLRPEAKDPERWFGSTEPDADCPTGMAVETMDIAGACAFFHPDHGCVLQKGAVDAGLHEWRIKPRFCILFPLVVSEGELTIDEDMKSIWCMKKRNRTHPVALSVRKEIRYLFGAEVERKILEASGCRPADRPREPQRDGEPRPAPPPP
ncbi:MAG: hypothetical protein Kow00128_14890 [Deltaproteobacteria bacterium]